MDLLLAHCFCCCFKIQIRFVKRMTARASVIVIAISSCRATAGVCLPRRDVYPSNIIRIFFICSYLSTFISIYTYVYICIYTYVHGIKIKTSLQYFIQIVDNGDGDKENVNVNRSRIGKVARGMGGYSDELPKSGFNMIFSWVAAKLISLR